ncbi:MAG: hypothetical protein QOE31_3597 [Solirubrobacteraceae bacterium]|jgi:hypothetical protein|nr:hypothetical protein [Solirubrobacteraceae bacterium]
METSLSGRCLCGAVRFKLTAAPIVAGYCHCTRCQRRTGCASSPQVRVDGGALEIVAGAQLLTWWRHPDGGFEKGFCAGCGGHLFSRNPDDHTQHTIRMSAFEADPGVRPSYRAFVAYAAPWEPIPDDGLPRYDERFPS